MTAEHDLVTGEFVKITVERPVTSLFGAETTMQTLVYFARFITWVDGQAVIEDARGNRALVDRAQVHNLDAVVPVEGPAS